MQESDLVTSCPVFNKPLIQNDQMSELSCLHSHPSVDVILNMFIRNNKYNHCYEQF